MWWRVGSCDSAGRIQNIECRVTPEPICPDHGPTLVVVEGTIVCTECIVAEAERIEKLLGIRGQ